MRSFFSLGTKAVDRPVSPGPSEKAASEDAASEDAAAEPVLECPVADGPVQELKALSADEQAVLARLRSEIPELVRDLPPIDEASRPFVDEAVPLDIDEWLTDECLARYIRARKGVYEDTRRALRKTIEWRAATRPHALRPDVVEIESRTGKMYLNGFDLLSRPIIYMYNHRQNTREPDNQIRWVIYALELCIRQMRPGVEKVTLAIDATGWGFSNAVSIGTARRFLDILSTHYPERLGRAVVFQPPRLFTAFYSLVSPFIDPVTKAKVAFVSTSDPARPAAGDGAASNSPWIAIEDCFDRRRLEKDCGGDWLFQYRHDVYWPMIEAEFARNKARLLARQQGQR
ncbi:hypothetical protein H4R18_003832 [Coemansia javaensis]|uniref:CRAL-TRIO domain-containing protein n=1 Tax=Coemansia javaensis TaxID=2761396 RepID=A0A9W8LH39_9FUNG|nr:hypothetical protein H4R18_003832 [Coemansia javaensis]